MVGSSIQSSPIEVMPGGICLPGMTFFLTSLGVFFVSDSLNINQLNKDFQPNQ